MVRTAKGWLLAATVASSTIVATSAATAFIPSSLQSGPDLAGSSFAASTVYDPATHTVVIAGSTFGKFFTNHGDAAIDSVPRETSNCFLAVVSLGSTTGTSSTPIAWKNLQTLGNDLDDADEACSVALYHPHLQKLIVTGQSEVEGFMAPLYNRDVEVESVQYGTLMDLDVASDGFFHPVGGLVLQDFNVIYPVMATTTVANFDKTKDAMIYLASHATNIGAVPETRVDAHSGQTLDEMSAETDPMRSFMFGDRYQLLLQSFSMKNIKSTSTLQETFAGGWRYPYATDNGSSVHVAAMAEIGDILVVVGSSEGDGLHFGGIGSSLGEGDMDGFITKFNKNTGQLAAAVAGTYEIQTTRIQSLGGNDDWIAGMCNSPNDLDHIYIVGATQGQLEGMEANKDSSTRAYILKVKLVTMETVWIQELGAGYDPNGLTHVRAVSCALSPDGKDVWFGGVVQNDAVLTESGTTKSFGQDDIFVAKLESEGGAIQFIRQIGSSDMDALAMRGGLAVDKDGNCVVVGNTYGEFYREQPTAETVDEAWLSSVFVTTISGDNGATAPQFGQVGFKNVPGTTPHPFKHEALLTPPAASETTDPSTTIEPVPGGLSGGIIAVIVSICLGLCILAIFLRSKSKTINGDVTTDRGHVIQFLNEFDVEDIDLKHSATGGWHCFYSNDLSRGRNHRAERGPVFGNLAPLERTLRSSNGNDALLTAPLTTKDSSILQDSLFMDDDDNNSEYGGSGLASRFGETRPSSQRQGYSGLIDAYNSSWDDRRSEFEPSTDSWGKEIL